MMIRDHLRLIRLCLRLLRKKAPGTFDVRRNAVSSRAIRYDLYHPRRKARNTIVLLHGCTVNGKDDPRLRHLARCLSASGSRCFVPTLPGLSKFQWTPSDIDGLVDFLLQLSGEKKSVGLTGFSYGGSYALLAAADPRIAARIAFVLSFGAYYSLEEVCAYHAALGREMPREPRARDSWIYLQLGMAKRHANRLPLSDQVQKELTDLLERYCHASTPNEKKRFYRRYLNSETLMQMEAGTIDKTALEQLSPAGRLGSLKCPVGLVHDAADYLVPVDHTRRMARELSAEGIVHRTLTTALLSHVNLTTMFNLSEWYRLAAHLLPMVQTFAEDV